MMPTLWEVMIEAEGDMFSAGSKIIGVGILKRKHKRFDILVWLSTNMPCLQASSLIQLEHWKMEMLDYPVKL